MELQTTRPFADYSQRQSFGAASQNSSYPVGVGNVTPTNEIAALDLYQHPFRVLVNDTKVYVMPGWVFGLKNSQVFWRNQVQMNSTDLGNPFLGQTMPTLPWAIGRLYLKITLSPNEILSCDIVFETEANAVDTYTVKWIWIAELKANQLVEQHLKSDVFVPVPVYGWSLITKNSITGTTTGTIDISEGCVMVQEFGGLAIENPVPTKLLTRLKIGANYKPQAKSNFAVNDGDLIYIKITFTSDTYGDSEVRFYEASDAEYVALSSVPTDNASFSYVYIGTVSIASSKMSISQKPPGVVTANNTVLPMRGAPAPDFEFGFFKATLTDTDEITIAPGWINWENIDITGTPGTFSAEHTPTDEYIVSGLSDGDYICLVMVREALTTISESFPDNDSLTVWSRKSGWRYLSYSFEISVGLPESDSTKKIVPIAWFTGGKCKQLHIGATDCPCVFLSSVSHED